MENHSANYIISTMIIQYLEIYLNTIDTCMIYLSACNLESSDNISIVNFLVHSYL